MIPLSRHVRRLRKGRSEMEQLYYASDKSGLDAGQIQEALKESISGILNQREACPGTGLKKVLIVGPDFSRYHSNAGLISNLYYHLFLEIKIGKIEM